MTLMALNMDDSHEAYPVASDKWWQPQIQPVCDR
jgi:hypothetical protein